MLSLLVASLVTITPVSPPTYQYAPAPTVNLSAVRLIVCKEGSGSGFLIGDNIVATAAHVASGTNCVDAATNEPLKTYNTDPVADFALMTGDLPDMRYIKVSCGGYKPGKVSAYGISSFHIAYEEFRQVDLDVGDLQNVEDDEGHTALNMRKVFGGYIVPGMSGGPHIQEGYAVGITNLGEYQEVLGLMFPEPMGYGRELKDTILCRHPAAVPQTPQTVPQNP